MRRRRHFERDELQALLRLGDPARGDPGPDSTTVERMRRAVLAEAEARRRVSGRRVGGVVLAAAVAAAAGVATLIWILPPRDVEPVRRAATPLEAAPAPPDGSLHGDAMPGPTDSAPGRPDPAEDASPAAVVAAVPRVEPLPRSQEEPPRTPRATTIRFTTRRGTQIIWTLDPRAEL